MSGCNVVRTLKDEASKVETAQNTLTVPPPRKLAIFVHYTNPASLPPAEHASALMTERGMKVILVGIRQGSPIDHLRMPAMAGRKIWTVRAPRTGIWLKAHYISFQLAVSVLVVIRRPTVVVANDILACPIAAVALRLSPQTRVIYHEHDSPARPITAVGRWLDRLRRFVVTRGAVTVVPNHRRRDLLLGMTRNASYDVRLVWNCPRRIEASPARRTEANTDDLLRLHYHGTIVPARLPMAVIDSLPMAPNVQLDVVGYTTNGSPRWDEALRERAAAIGVADRVVISGPADRREIMDVARAADIGWAAIADESADPANLGAMMGASVKVFEYFAAGLPVLVNATAEWVDDVVGPGYGFSCDPRDPVAIAMVLRSLDVRICRLMGEAARQRVVEEWNYDVQYQPVLDAVLGER